jgi:hypothetical protein
VWFRFGVIVQEVDLEQISVRWAAKTSHEVVAFLLIEQASDGIFLYSFSSDAVCLGDTWHQAIEDAKAQAKQQFGSPESAWRKVPPQLNDLATIIRFVQKLDD